VPLLGEAKEDWKSWSAWRPRSAIPFSYQSAADVRRDIAAAFPVVAELQGLAAMTFNAPLEARSWRRRRTRRSDGSGTSCTRICRRSKAPSI